jgi:hypothetical protein
MSSYLTKRSIFQLFKQQERNGFVGELLKKKNLDA